MSDTLPPRTSRHLPLRWAGVVVVATAAGGLMAWLGQRPADPSPVILAAAKSDFLAAVTRLNVPDMPPAKAESDANPPATVPPPPARTALPDPVDVPAPLASPSPVAAPPATVIRPSFDIVRVSPLGETVLAGRAAPGARVTITDNGRKIAEATGDQQGQWVALPGAALPAGGQQLALSSTTPSGGVVAGEAPLLVVVPAARPPATAPSSAPPTALAILTPRDAAPRVLQGPPAAPSAHGGKTRLGLDVVDYDEHGAIRFSGLATPGSVVRAYIDNRPAGDATTDLDGHWSLSPAAPVAAGDHRLRVDQLGTGRKVTGRVELPFERTAVPDADPGEGRIVVQPRETLWRIARHAYGQGTRYTVIYRANRDQIRDPDMIFPGQIFDVPPLPPR